MGGDTKPSRPHLRSSEMYSARAHMLWKETKLQPGTAGPGNMLGCCLVSFHFLWAILSTSTVAVTVVIRGLLCKKLRKFVAKFVANF